MMRNAFTAGMAALTLALSAQAQTPAPPAKQNPFVGDVKAVDDGRDLYNTTCTTCHGVNGGAGEFAPGLAISGRSYANRTDDQVFLVIKNGIPGTAMPPHAGRLPDDQIWKIAAYIRGLRGTAIDAPHPGDVAAGEQVFWGKGACGACHVVSGRGAITGPDLTTIANRAKVGNIVDALTKENNRAYPPGGFQSYQLVPIVSWPVVDITTNDGRQIRGLLRNEDGFSMQVIGLDQKLHLLQRSDLKTVVYEKKRLMPSDYDKRLTPKEFNDLLAYVTRLGRPVQQQSAR